MTPPRVIPRGGMPVDFPRLTIPEGEIGVPREGPAGAPYPAGIGRVAPLFPLPDGQGLNHGVLNPRVDPTATSSKPVGDLGEGAATLVGVDRTALSHEDGVRTFIPDEDGATVDPVAARRALALEMNPLISTVPDGDGVVRRRTSLDDRLEGFGFRLSIYRHVQFPNSTALQSIAERSEALLRDYHNTLSPTFTSDCPFSRDWDLETARLEVELNAFLVDEARREMAASSRTLLDVAHNSGNPALEARVEALADRLAESGGGIPNGETSFQEFRKIFAEVLAARAHKEARDQGMGYLPEPVERGLYAVAANLSKLHVASNGLSATALENFIYSAVSWAHDFPPPEGTAAVDFVQPVTSHHYVLGTKPSADALLNTMTNNLEGYRGLFGDRAGAIFYRQERLVSRIPGADGQPTNFYMTVERGSHEYDTGVRVAIWEGDPAGQHEHAPVARLGLNIGGDRSIQIANLQGPSRELREADWRQAPRPGAYERLQDALGGGRPFNMMLGMVIHWAHGAGFQRVYGIRDEAQGARASGLAVAAEKGSDVSGRGDMYRMIFGSFGFKSRADNPDYVVLDLTRGSHSDYMAKVLRKGARKIEAGVPSDGPERSFWGRLLPAWNLFQPVPVNTPLADAPVTGANPLEVKRK